MGLLSLLVVAACHRPPASANTSAAGAPFRAQNLRVLPADLARDSLLTLMRGMAGGLGVTCQYCHVTDARLTPDSSNFASDEKRPKRIARSMLRLVQRINAELSAGTDHPEVPSIRVDCMTCHRGLPRPILLEDSLQRVLDVQGVDSTLSEYHRLRARYHGRGGFDFGLRTLNVLSERLLASSRYAEALPLAMLNAELFKDRWETSYALGRAYEGLADTAAAIVSYRAVLESVPNHSQARDRLARLTRRPR